jgi:hydroxyacylglutathione hydrolase
MAALLGYFAYFKGWIFNDFKNISPQEAHALLEKSQNITLLDVRSKKEFDEDHLKGAIFIPREVWDIENSYVNSNRTTIVYSERGERSVEAARILAKRGVKVLNIEGGVVFWIRAGYKVVK